MGAIAESDNFVSWTFEGQPGTTLHIALFSDVTNCRYELADLLIALHNCILKLLVLAEACKPKSKLEKWTLKCPC